MDNFLKYLYLVCKLLISFNNLITCSRDGNLNVTKLFGLGLILWLFYVTFSVKTSLFTFSAKNILKLSALSLDDLSGSFLFFDLPIIYLISYDLPNNLFDILYNFFWSNTASLFWLILYLCFADFKLVSWIFLRSSYIDLLIAVLFLLYILSLFCRFRLLLTRMSLYQVFFGRYTITLLFSGACLFKQMLILLDNFSINGILELFCLILLSISSRNWIIFIFEMAL